MVLAYIAYSSCCFSNSPFGPVSTTGYSFHDYACFWSLFTFVFFLAKAITISFIMAFRSQIPISYWLNDGYRFWNITDFRAYHPLIGEEVSPYSTPLKTEFCEY